MNIIVCRLCCSKKNLLWVFDTRICPEIPSIVKIICGVEISRYDTISQRICSACRDLNYKMYEFRQKAIANDTYLKEESAKMEQLLVKKDARKKTYSKKSYNPLEDPKYKTAHPSIIEILKQYPKTKLPEIPLNAHFGPYITLITDEVNDYLASSQGQKKGKSVSNAPPNKKIKLNTPNLSKEMLKKKNVEIVDEIVPTLASNNAQSKPQLQEDTSSNLKTTQVLNFKVYSSFVKKSTGCAVKRTDTPPPHISNCVTENVEGKKVEKNITQKKIPESIVKVYICNYCKVRYLSEKSLRIHVKKVHAKCPYCNVKFASALKRDEHVKLGCCVEYTEDASGLSNDDKPSELVTVTVLPQIENVVTVANCESSNNYFKIVNPHVSKLFNGNDDDLVTLKNLLTYISSREQRRLVVNDVMQRHPIRQDGKSRVLYVFKNLSSELSAHDIPVDITFSAMLSVDYALAPRPQKTFIELWDDIKPKVISSHSSRCYGSRTTPKESIDNQFDTTTKNADEIIESQENEEEIQEVDMLNQNQLNPIKIEQDYETKNLDDLLKPEKVMSCKEAPGNPLEERSLQAVVDLPKTSITSESSDDGKVPGAIRVKPLGQLI